MQSTDDERVNVATSVDTQLRLKTGELVENNSALIVALTNFFIKQMGAGGIPFILPAEEALMSFRGSITYDQPFASGSEAEFAAEKDGLKRPAKAQLRGSDIIAPVSSLPRLVLETEADGVLGDGALDLIGDAVWKSGINFHTHVHSRLRVAR